jgi:hypothetical protein
MGGQPLPQSSSFEEIGHFTKGATGMLLRDFSRRKKTKGRIKALLLAE